jgi:hypothetical protein
VGSALAATRHVRITTIAWKTRHALNLDNVPGGVAPGGNDNIIYDIGGSSEHSRSGFDHPQCSRQAPAIGEALPSNYPTGSNP